MASGRRPIIEVARHTMRETPLRDILDEAVLTATPSETREAIPMLREVIARERSGEAGSSRCLRFGRDRGGRQIYLCRGRSLTSTTGGLVARSGLSEGQWLEFCACAADSLSLRETARRVRGRLH